MTAVTLPDTAWFVQPPNEFMDRRMQMKRTGTVHVNVRAYRGVIVRRKDGQQEYDRCPHAHQKPGAARQCAEQTAKRLNRQ